MKQEVNQEIDGVMHHHLSAIESHQKHGGCWECCNRCNYNDHRCHFCGTDLTHDSRDCDGRHWLSDCRPDLVQHEEGELCTWPKEIFGDWKHNCYAFQEMPSLEWTDSHSHFMPDGPMA